MFLYVIDFHLANIVNTDCKKVETIKKVKIATLRSIFSLWRNTGDSR